jgi:hypothetical protein
MILNSFLRANDLWMGIKYRKRLGINLNAAYKMRYPDKPLKKVKLIQQKQELQVCDYPMEFLLGHGKIILARFCKRYNIKKQVIRKPKSQFQDRYVPKNDLPVEEKTLNGKRPRLKKVCAVKVEAKRKE